MAEVRVAAELRPPEPPPEASQPGFVVWLRKNLFNTPFNGVLTVILVLVVVLVGRGLLAFLLSEDRMWAVIPRNSANYVIEAYPREDLFRMWISLGVAAGLVGLSLATWRPQGRIEVAKLVAGFRALGVALFAVGLLAPDVFDARTTFMVTGAIVFAITAVVMWRADDLLRDRAVPTMGVIAGAAAVFLLVLWLLPIAASTQGPLTIEVGVALLAYVVGRPLASRAGSRMRAVVTGAWLLSLPVIYLHIERNPQIPVSRVSEWIPWLAVIGVAGIGLLQVVSRSNRERAGLVNAVLVIASILIWVISAPIVARVLLLMLTVVSLATPTFGSSDRGRKGVTWAWIGLFVLVIYLFVIGVSSPGLDTRNEYFGGLNLTLMFAAAGILLSFPLGIVLALGRTSSMPIFRLLSTGYIETIRGVPLITLLFFARYVILNFIPSDLQPSANILVLIGITLFSAAYLAENVRGGLQSIPKGQYEAAYAMGMTTAQMTMLITLPQALRAVIPAIVGQVISLFKDTSLVAIVGLADFFRVAREIVPNQPASLGSVIENLIFAAIVYWLFTFTFSRASQRLERKLGVGAR